MNRLPGTTGPNAGGSHRHSRGEESHDGAVPGAVRLPAPSAWPAPLLRLASLPWGAITCPRVRLLIDDHVDGLLPARDAERVRDHLDTCNGCRQAAEVARAASTSLAAWGDLEPPARCFDDILVKIRSLPPEALSRPARVTAADLRRDLIRRWAGPSLAAAAAVVAAVLVIHQTDVAPRRPIAPGIGPISATALGPAGFARSPRTLQPFPADDPIEINGVRRVFPLRGGGGIPASPAGFPVSPR